MPEHTSDHAITPASEAQQRALLDFAVSQSSAIFYIADLAGDKPVRFISSNVQAITGHKPSAFLQESKYGYRHIHPEDLAGYELGLEVLREQGESTHEYRFRNSEGAYRWFRDELRLAKSGDGSLEFVGCMLDITAEKETEALKAAIIAAAQDAVIAIDDTGRALEFNAEAEEMFGYSREQVLGRPISELIVPDHHRAAHIAGLNRVKAAGRSTITNKRLQVEAMRSDGSLFPAEITMTQAKAGERSIYVAEVKDLSDIVAVEQERQRLAQLLADAVASLPNGFAIYDADGRLVLANDAVAQVDAHDQDPSALVGLSRQEVILRLLPNIRTFDGCGIVPTKAMAKEIDERLQRLRNGSVEIELNNGSWRLLSCHPTSEGGQVLISTDVTKLKHAEAALRESEKLFRALVENHPLPMWMVDLESGQILYESPAAGELIGRAWSPGEKHSVLDYYADPEERKPLVAASKQKEELRNYEVEFKRADGSPLWVSINSRFIEYQGREVIVTGLVDLTERKRMEQALRESDALIRRVVEDCPLPMYMTRVTDGRILYESPASRAAFGVPYDGASDWIQDRYVTPEYRSTFLSELRKTGALDEYEIGFRRGDGSTFIGAVSSRLIDYRGEEVIVSSTIDMTERKRRESELRHARETLEDAIEALTEGFALYDADDRLVVCNSRFRWLNEPYGDIFVLGVAWCDVTRARAEKGLFPQAIGRVDDYIEEKRRRRGESEDDEFELSDGRWIAMSHRPTRQGGIVHTWREITERRQMEQALRDSEARVRTVLEACPVPITMNRVDDGVIIYESPAAYALLRYDEPQEGSSVVSRWANPDDRRAYLKLLRRTGAVDGLEIRYRKADGEVFPCALSARLIEYRGEPVIVSNLFDLTERRAAEAELAHQREMLHQSEKLSALGELLAGISHELNNPLSVLVGQALMLRETALDDRTAARAEKIGKAADRCARIVKTFLAMARQEPSETVPVDLNAVIEGALEVTGYALRTSGIDVSLRMAKALPPVMADPDQMRQVFINLIVNAQHALQDVDGPRRLRITSSYRKPTEQVVIKVKDNGPGIPAEARTRIFEPFYTTKDIGTGTGIGLALCHRIVEAHGGTIVVESPAGEGTAFAIRLLATRAKDERSAKAPRAGVSPETYRVLVVDDDSDVVYLICEILERGGHTVEVAGSGRLALQKIKRRSYDVILCDIRMPGMDGPAFYRALRDAKSDQIGSLAFITGDTLSPRVKEFLDASQRPYLEKPITPREIRALVDLLMRRKAS
jgi:PAS domain S-box-containing protein